MTRSREGNVALAGITTTLHFRRGPITFRVFKYLGPDANLASGDRRILRETRHDHSFVPKEEPLGKERSVV